MKKLFALLTVLALLLPVLAGCGNTLPIANPDNISGAPQPTQTTPVTPTPDPATETTAPTTPAVPETQLSRDEAVDIALKDAGLTKEEIQDLDVELDRDIDTLHYDVDFEKNDRDYDYEIDANTGKILKKDVPKEPESKPASSNNTSSNNTASNEKTSSNKTSTTKQLTREKARDIALKHAGLSASAVRDLDVELDRDDGTVHYDVDFEADGYDYDYEIHAESGKILKSQKERD